MHKAYMEFEIGDICFYKKNKKVVIAEIDYYFPTVFKYRVIFDAESQKIFLDNLSKMARISAYNRNIKDCRLYGDTNWVNENYLEGFTKEPFLS